MAKPNITQVATSQTFQTWLDKTNDIVTLFQSDVMTASALGDSTTGNAILVGNFTANNLIAEVSLQTNTISPRPGFTKISHTAPIQVNTSGTIAQTLVSPVGPKINYSSGTITWRTGFQDVANNSFTIDTGTGTNKLVLTPTGDLTIAGKFIPLGGIELPSGTTLTGNLVGDVTGNVAGNLTGNVTGNVAGNLTGNVTGNVAGNLTGDVTGNLTGNVTGNVAGNLTGNVTGNVAGNLTGNVTGNVAGNLTGNVTGDIYSNNGVKVFENGVNGTDAFVTGHISSISNHTTNNLAEGSNNLYHTNQRVIDAINGAPQGTITSIVGVKGFIAFNGATGQVISSAGLSVTKNGTGEYTISIAAGYRPSNSNYAVVTGSVSDGIYTLAQDLTPSPTDVELKNFTSVVSNRATTSFKINVSKTLNTFVGIASDDNIGSTRFGLTRFDATYVTALLLY